MTKLQKFGNALKSFKDLFNLLHLFLFKPTKNLIRPADSHSSWSMTDKEINPSLGEADLNLQRFKPCSKKASYEKNGQFFCEKHATTVGVNLGHIIPTKDISESSRKKLSREDLIAMGISHGCNTVAELKTKKAVLENLHAFFLDRCFIPIVTKKRIAASDIDLITIGRNMKTQLDLLKEVSKNTTHVIMENQISPLAGRMKTIQGMLAQYYIMNSDQENPIEIIFVSSTNKLKGLTNETQTQNQTQTPTQKETYRKHKLDSIDICNRFLNENPSLSSWSQAISSKAKKDDFADCFLQGIWYLKQSKIITYADNLKINLV